MHGNTPRVVKGRRQTRQGINLNDVPEGCVSVVRACTWMLQAHSDTNLALNQDIKRDVIFGKGPDVSFPCRQRLDRCQLGALIASCDA